jgi:hypothetical protein
LINFEILFACINSKFDQRQTPSNLQKESEQRQKFSIYKKRTKHRDRNQDLQKENEKSKKPSCYRRGVSEKPDIYALKNSKQRQNPAIMEGDRTETETQIYRRRANRDRNPVFCGGRANRDMKQAFTQGE